MAAQNQGKRALDPVVLAVIEDEQGVELLAEQVGPTGEVVVELKAAARFEPPRTLAASVAGLAKNVMSPITSMATTFGTFFKSWLLLLALCADIVD